MHCGCVLPEGPKNSRGKELSKEYGLIWYHCSMTTQHNYNYYRCLKRPKRTCTHDTAFRENADKHVTAISFLSSFCQIALESVVVIDNGETMLVEGLRVAPQERGKGVAGVLLRFCSELVKSKFPEVKVTRLTRDDTLGPKDFQKYRIITKQVSETNADDASY